MRARCRSGVILQRLAHRADCAHLGAVKSRAISQDHFVRFGNSKRALTRSHVMIGRSRKGRSHGRDDIFIDDGEVDGWSYSRCSLLVCYSCTFAASRILLLCTFGEGRGEP